MAEMAQDEDSLEHCHEIIVLNAPAKAVFDTLADTLSDLASVASLSLSLSLSERLVKVVARTISTYSDLADNFLGERVQHRPGMVDDMTLSVIASIHGLTRLLPLLPVLVGDMAPVDFQVVMDSTLSHAASIRQLLLSGLVEQTCTHILMHALRWDELRYDQTEEPQRVSKVFRKLGTSLCTAQHSHRMYLSDEECATLFARILDVMTAAMACIQPSRPDNREFVSDCTPTQFWQRGRLGVDVDGMAIDDTEDSSQGHRLGDRHSTLPMFSPMGIVQLVLDLRFLSLTFAPCPTHFGENIVQKIIADVAHLYMLANDGQMPKNGFKDGRSDAWFDGMADAEIDRLRKRLNVPPHLPLVWLEAPETEGEEEEEAVE
ncbi:hypothetical protein KIPB_007804 [Kipferlia bialata]|uniref:Uncharacterized protein n=1 Tax=Kipferlia bialata TaxID=797122 RepID=A0A9K3D2B9_9EUKA|nr:hypothetical protein KIPB_007804 [Kipferlia bialata]|eukprot:g7804.t1